MQTIAALRNAHPGADAYIVAAGPSMDYIDPAFFDGKLVIGVNSVYERYRCDYIVRKELIGLDETSAAADLMGAKVVVSEYNCGAHNSVKNYSHGCYVFSHRHNFCTAIEWPEPDSDELVVSYSTITSAMHLGAYLGAKTLMLCGHDCGTLDGQVRMDGYPSPILGDEFYYRWIGQIEPQTMAVRDWLQKHFGVLVYSLNPFVNFGLEGHQYARP